MQKIKTVKKYKNKYIDFYIIFFLKIFCKNYLTLYYTRFNILNVSGKRITLPRGVNYERSNL